jgi:hypothetical protein
MTVSVLLFLFFLFDDFFNCDDVDEDIVKIAGSFRV